MRSIRAFTGKLQDQVVAPRGAELVCIGCCHHSDYFGVLKLFLSGVQPSSVGVGLSTIYPYTFEDGQYVAKIYLSGSQLSTWALRMMLSLVFGTIWSLSRQMSLRNRMTHRTCACCGANCTDTMQLKCLGIERLLKILWKCLPDWVSWAVYVAVQRWWPCLHVISVGRALRCRGVMHLAIGHGSVSSASSRHIIQLNIISHRASVTGRAQIGFRSLWHLSPLPCGPCGTGAPESMWFEPALLWGLFAKHRPGCFMASWLLWLRKHCQRIRIPTCSDVFSPVQVVAASREEMTSQWTPSLWTSSLPLNSSQHLSSRTRSPRRRWGSTVLPVFAPSLMTFDLSSPQRTFMNKTTMSA